MELHKESVACKFSELKTSDIDEVLELYNYYIENTTYTFHVRPLTHEEMRGIVLFDDGRYKTFLIYDEDQFCGYCILSRYSHREAYDITAEITIYLKPEYTKRGVGGQAIKFLEDYANKKGINVLLAVVSEENKASMRLFRKNGYKKCAHFKKVGKKFNRLLDVIIFQKDINC
ncbi:MAG: N-acetyltransferase [Spirochaetales bacterium]|nr:N-acetyltransferase [Spirochaetales bacterium]